MTCSSAAMATTRCSAGPGPTPRSTAARPAVASTSRWKPGPDWPDSDGWPNEAVGDNFSSIENLVGTKFNDWLAADAGDNRRGNDWIFGGSDEDTLLGGEGHDNLFGGRSDDMLFGGVGADNLFGDAGDDMLFGGDGPDRIDGGPGSDTVTFVGAAGWRDGEPR